MTKGSESWDKLFFEVHVDTHHGWGLARASSGLCFVCVCDISVMMTDTLFGGKDATNWVAWSNRNLFFHDSGGLKSKIKDLQGHTSCEICLGESFPASSELPVVAVCPSLVLFGLPLHHTILFLGRYMVFFPCLCLHMAFSFLWPSLSSL